jgi:hypothetical protein
MTCAFGGYGSPMAEALRVAPPPAAPTAAHQHDARPWWRTPPVDTRGLLLWVATFVVMTTVVAVVGLLLVHDLSSIRSLDDEVARGLARRRTDTWDHVTFVGSFIADAYVKIPAAALLGAAARRHGSTGRGTAYARPIHEGTTPRPGVERSRSGPRGHPVPGRLRRRGEARSR